MHDLLNCGITMAYMKVSTLKNLLMRHKGFHMEWSHILKLAILKDIHTNNLNEWFNTKCDLMAWVSEDSKERLRGTKQGWRASDGLATEEPS
jgi:hypothetical protein